MARIILGIWLLISLPLVTGQTPPETKTEAKPGEKTVSLRWYGQSYFILTTGDGTRIGFDPHGMPEYGRQITTVDLACISHLHGDHTQIDVFEKEPKTLYGLNPKDRKQSFVKINEKFKNASIRTVASYHDMENGLARGRNAIFIIETDGLKIVHLGDLGHTLEQEQIREIGPVDVLLIPVGGVYTINGEKAKEVVKQLKPRLYTIPMHYGTRALDSLQPVDEFLEGEKNVKKMEDNHTLTIPVNLKSDVPQIVLLSWK
jgi:L-ascorbate metabolism protein UlaG (beta-lactamase superfamily)